MTPSNKAPKTTTDCKDKSSQKSSQKSPQEIIKPSGNLHHARVAKWFKENGWHVHISPNYMDPSQEKAREIDLIVEKSFPVKSESATSSGNPDGDTHKDVLFRLYVECKYINVNSLFWFAEKDKGSAYNLITDKVRSLGYKESSDYTFANEHHYLKTCAKVAKLFELVRKDQGQDPFYKASNQVLNACVSMDSSMPTIIPELQQNGQNRRSVRYRIDFPIIVCNSFDNLQQTDFYQETPPKPIGENFQIEVLHAYQTPEKEAKNQYFLIDVVDFNRLKEFIDLIEEDAKITVELARHQDYWFKYPNPYRNL